MSDAPAGAPPWAVHLPPDVSWQGLDLAAGVSIPAVMAGLAAADAGRPVLYTPTTGWISRGALDDETARVAGRFAAAGLRPGDRLLCSANPSAALVIAHVAALRSGLVVVPMNTAYQQAEVAHFVADARPAAAVLDRPDAAEWVRRADPTVLVTGPAVELDDGPVPRLDQAESGDPALIGYTSGTTGRPKGAVLSHGNLLASVESLRLAWRWTPDDRLILALPLFHAHGLGVALHGTLVTGASTVVLDHFDTDDVLDAVVAHDATMFFGVPTMYSRLAVSSRVDILGRLRLLVSGSAPLAAELHARILSGSGQVILERYGMTETLMLVSNPYQGQRRAGTVGWPLPGVELRLAASSSSGEISVRGPSVFGGYWDRPAGEGFDDEGWFATGDIGRFDDDGYLSIVGRAKELIISGGYNIYPREVEDLLVTHPDVAEAAVIGVPSAEWGETVTAFVVTVPDSQLDAAALIAFSRSNLAHFKCPREIRFVTSLPRNAMGKVVRAQLL